MCALVCEFFCVHVYERADQANSMEGLGRKRV